jgi:hypothetical protein
VVAVATLRRLVLTLSAGLAVAGSFWLTLQVIDRLASPTDPDADLIKITQASYGLNCQNSAPWVRQTYQVKAGNVTDAVAASCSGTRKVCSYAVDVGRLGDPAPGCGKDLSIEWRCGTDKEPRRYHLDPEANSQTAYIGCP